VLAYGHHGWRWLTWLASRLAYCQRGSRAYNNNNNAKNNNNKIKIKLKK